MKISPLFVFGILCWGTSTVSAQEKAKVAQRDSIPNEMNASDHRSKHTGYSRIPVSIMPSVGVGYCHHCW